MKKIIFFKIILLMAMYAQNISDFIVNDENYASHCVKDFVASSRDSLGNSVFVWIDSRSSIPAVYGQRINRNGSPTDSNFKINEDTIYVAAKPPDVGCDGVGRFVVIWEAIDRDFPYKTWIYGRRFAETGVPLGPTFTVDTTHFGNPAVGVSRNGNFVIAWPDSHPVLGQRIFAQRYDRSGQQIDTIFIANDFGQESYFPRISFDRNGNFIITWINRVPNIVCGQIFDSLANRIDTNFTINDSGGPRMDLQKEVSVNYLNNGNFIVAWNGEKSPPGPIKAIYARMFYSNGQPMDWGFKVNDHDTTPNSPAWPAVCTYGNNSFVIAWQDCREWCPDIYAQRYDSTGNRVGENFLVNDTASRTTRSRLEHPTVVGNNNRFIIAWRKRHSPFNNNIVFKVYDSNGIARGPNQLLSTDKGYAYQFAPCITRGPDKRFFITWSDTRHKFIDAYAKLFDSLGNVLTSDFEVNHDTTFLAFDEGSSVASNDSIYFVTWQEDRHERLGNLVFGLLGQIYDLNAIPIGGNFWIVKDSSYNYQLMNPRVAASQFGKFVVTWQRLNSSRKYDIYARRYDRQGRPSGDSFKVNDRPGNMQNHSLAVAPTGYFIICWQDVEQFAKIWAQRYDSLGNRIDTNFVMVNEGAFPPSHIAVDNGGNFVLTWESNDFRIYGKRFNSSGDSIGPRFQVNESSILPFYANPVVTCREAHEFFIVWQDLRAAVFDLWGQYYRQGQPVGQNQKINQHINNCYHETPSIDADQERVYISWTGLTYLPYNYDVYAKVINWSDLISVAEANHHPIVDARFQVLPNPAKGKVIIRIPAIPTPEVKGQKSDVRLKIYDVSGSLVKDFSLASHFPPPSTIAWDGRDSAGREVRNGVYFCQLRIGDEITNRKVILLR